MRKIVSLTSKVSLCNIMFLECDNNLNNTCLICFDIKFPSMFISHNKHLASKLSIKLFV